MGVSKEGEKMKTEAQKLAGKKYYLKNKELVIHKVKEQRALFPEKIKVWAANSRKKRKGKIREYESKRRGTLEYKQHFAQWKRERRKRDILFKLRIDLSRRISYDLFAYLNQTKQKTTLTYVNFSILELKNHLEKQFTPEMNWENHGIVWDIGHRIPSSWARNEAEMKDIIYSLNNFFPVDSNFNRYVQSNNFALLDNIKIYDKIKAFLLFKSLYGVN